jgi:hypothetical protein
MKTLLKIAASLTILAIPAAASAEVTYPVDVPFAQAAIYFMFGKEGKDVTYETDLTPTITYSNKFGPVVMRATVKDRLLISGGHSIPGSQGAAVPGTWEVLILENKQCILYVSLIDPVEAFDTVNMWTGEGNGGRRLEFNKLPSPRSFVSSGNGNYQFSLPDETWCSYRQVIENGKVLLLRGSSTCSTGIHFKLNDHWVRRINALDYIRTNYCPGQPEPAPRPRLPY